MKTVLLLGGPAAGQRIEVHGTMLAIEWSELLPFDGAMHPSGKTHRYKVVPMCSHGEVHWFGVLDGADPLALLIAGYSATTAPVEAPAEQRAYGRQPTRIDIRSATRLHTDRLGSTSVVRDIVEARRLLADGYAEIGINTFRKEFYE